MMIEFVSFIKLKLYYFLASLKSIHINKQASKKQTKGQLKLDQFTDVNLNNNNNNNENCPYNSNFTCYAKWCK